MKNYKLTNQRPEISKQEADQYANFDLLVETSKSLSDQGTNFWRIGRSIILFMAIIALVFYGIEKDAFEVNYPKPGMMDKEVQTVMETESALPSSKETGIKEESQSASSSIQKEPKVSSEKLIPSETETINAKEESENSAIGFVEAAPVEGFPALYQYFDENLVYPEEILGEGIEGNVIVKFEINTQGTSGKIIIEKSLHRKLDSTAIALIQNMPLWNPATLNGQPISSTHRIPLFFQIDQKEE